MAGQCLKQENSIYPSFSILDSLQSAFSTTGSMLEKLEGEIVRQNSYKISDNDMDNSSSTIGTGLSCILPVYLNI